MAGGFHRPVQIAIRIPNQKSIESFFQKLKNFFKILEVEPITSKNFLPSRACTCAHAYACIRVYARRRTCICEQARVARICAHRHLYASERATLACIRTLGLSAGPERSGGEKFFIAYKLACTRPKVWGVRVYTIRGFEEYKHAYLINIRARDQLSRARVHVIPYRAYAYV